MGGRVSNDAETADCHRRHEAWSRHSNRQDVSPSPDWGHVQSEKGGHACLGLGVIVKICDNVTLSSISLT